jgi:lipopolysaccharide/colanic/teichoic acid biosynthesis glycosyltransferase
MDMSFAYSLIAETQLDRSPLVAGLVVVGFMLAWRVYQGLGWRRGAATRVLILGDGPLAWQIGEAIGQRPHCRYVVVGLVTDPVGLHGIIERRRPDLIVVAFADLRARLPLSPLLDSRTRGVLVEDASAMYERLTGKLALESLRPSNLIFAPEFRRPRAQLALSRLLSFLVAIVGLILLAPLFALIAVLIKLDSRGPVFFVQERVGLLGRSFKLIKFRTMHPASRPRSEWQGDNYDRITRVGKRLRRFRLDELPQLVNVLRGDMNLVGPRPHPVTNLGLMTLVARNLSDVSGTAIPYYSIRCSIRPGITGWAQVRYGYADSLEEEMEKIRYDFYYLKHMSFWLDLRILFETVRRVFAGDGSAAARHAPTPARRSDAGAIELERRS